MSDILAIQANRTDGRGGCIKKLMSPAYGARMVRLAERPPVNQYASMRQPPIRGVPNSARQVGPKTQTVNQSRLNNA